MDQLTIFNTITLNEMNTLPEEIQILIFSYVSPTNFMAYNVQSNILSRCNVIWGPIVYKMFGVRHSNNFWQEFKWQLQLQKHRLDYQRRWTLGCVGKTRPIGRKPIWTPAYTTWALQG